MSSLQESLILAAARKEKRDRQQEQQETDAGALKRDIEDVERILDDLQDESRIELPSSQGAEECELHFKDEKTEASKVPLISPVLQFKEELQTSDSSIERNSVDIQNSVDTQRVASPIPPGAERPTQTKVGTRVTVKEICNIQEANRDSPKVGPDSASVITPKQQLEQLFSRKAKVFKWTVLSSLSVVAFFALIGGFIYHHGQKELDIAPTDGMAYQVTELASPDVKHTSKPKLDGLQDGSKSQALAETETETEFVSSPVIQPVVSREGADTQVNHAPFDQPVAPSPAAHFNEELSHSSLGLGVDVLAPRSQMAMPLETSLSPGEPPQADDQEDPTTKSFSNSEGWAGPSRESAAKAKARDLSFTLLKAFTAFEAGSWSASAALYGEVVSLDTKNIDGLLGLAAVSSMQGKAGDAVDLYRQVLELDPSNTQAISALVSNASRVHVDESMISSMDLLISKNGSSAGLMFVRGSLHAAQSDWKRAREDFLQSWILNQKQAEYAFNTAIAMDHLGDTKDAIKFYKLALQLSDQYSTLLDRRAIVFRLRELGIGYE